MRGTVCVRQRQLPFESALERDFLDIVEFDNSAIDVQGQPVAIKVSGRVRPYIPDFLVLYDDGVRTSRVLYEVKYRVDLRTEWQRLKPGFLAARRYARENGIRFSIMTEVEIRGPYLYNWKFLSSFLNRDPEGEVEEHLVRTLAVLGPTTPATLLEAAYRDRDQRLNAIGSMWRILALRRIHAEMHEPLTMLSTIWVNVGEGF